MYLKKLPQLAIFKNITGFLILAAETQILLFGLQKIMMLKFQELIFHQQ